MVDPHSSNFRVITTNFLGVRIFRKFTVCALILVNRLEELILPRNSVSRLTDGSLHVPLMPSYVKNHDTNFYMLKNMLCKVKDTSKLILSMRFQPYC